jgi:DNA-binding transcriptional regulator YbjK
MAFDEAALLRDLRRTLEESAGLSQEALAAALRDVLSRHGATQDDLSRLLSRAARQRRARELSGLAQRLEQVADQREDALATAEAADTFLRSLGRDG